jgi:hypothetical protein
MLRKNRQCIELVTHEAAGVREHAPPQSDDANSAAVWTIKIPTAWQSINRVPRASGNHDLETVQDRVWSCAVKR